MKLSLVHDLAEALVGDITPTCGVSEEDKHRLEAAAMQQIRGMLGGGGCLAGTLGSAAQEEILGIMGSGLLLCKQLRHQSTLTALPAAFSSACRRRDWGLVAGV
jgi:hypothetical protein